MKLKKEEVTEQKEALKILYANIRSGLAISIITSVIMVFGFNFSENDNDINLDKVIWLIAMLFVLILRFVDALLFSKEVNYQSFVPDKYILRFFLGCVVTAALWSFYAIWFYATASTIEITTTIIILSSLAGGSVNVLSGSRYTAMLFSFILIAPYSCFLIFSEVHYLQILGGLGISFSFIMLLTSNKSASFTQQAIRLKYLNTHLLADMEEKVEKRTAQIYRLSNTDSLTGFLNRTAFIKECKKELNSNSHNQYALFFIDLDRFKQINDSLGHEAGDSVLKETAARISTQFPNYKSKCRWGGDEFLVFIPYNDGDETNQLAYQLIEDITAPQACLNYQEWVSATIGIAIYPDNGRDLNSLIKSADIAMYHQKRLNKGAFALFDQSLQLKLEREHYLSIRLKSAIAENALRLVLQPIVDSHTNQVSCFEALLRWQMDGENVTPDEFIPIAEQYNLINEIGYWVIKQACTEYTQYNLDTNQIAISVNVSVIQLQDKHFVSTLHEIIKSFNISPENIHLEVTESIFANDRETFLHAIKSLQSLGFCISIDDFGTGYSSLSSMLDMGVDIVKIDKSFVQTMDENGLSIINAVVQIASSLNFNVVAEGVETQAQATILKEVGVSHLQGYYFSKPIECIHIYEYLHRQESN
jgi:diguanylate cyclase (GGDEF)-like protein